MTTKKEKHHLKKFEKFRTLERKYSAMRIYKSFYSFLNSLSNHKNSKFRTKFNVLKLNNLLDREYLTSVNDMKAHFTGFVTVFPHLNFDYCFKLDFLRPFSDRTYFFNKKILLAFSC